MPASSKSSAAPSQKSSSSGTTVLGGIATTIGAEPPKPIEPDLHQLGADVPLPQQPVRSSASVVPKDVTANEELDIPTMIALGGIMAILLIGSLAVFLMLRSEDISPEDSSDDYNPIPVPDLGDVTQVAGGPTSARRAGNVSRLVSTAPPKVPRGTS
ncbi:uncharacterized protein LOC144180431 [Haemaphysalis longicornis]